MTNTRHQLLLHVLLLFLAAPTNALITPLKRDTLILAFDGVIASTAQTHAKLAIQAALRTWPHLKENPNINIEENNNNNDWLVNKMMALSHLHMPSDMGYERVLLARMLLEEQKLDEQRSVGKRGKYASKFHPSSEPQTTDAASSKSIRHSRSNNVGSRPLTVGEISVNWSDGACLLDTLSVRYHVNRSNPLPIIRNCLQDIIATASSSFSDDGNNDKNNENDNDILYDAVHVNVNAQIAQELSQCASEVFIVLPHKCYLDSAVRLLSKNVNANLRVGTSASLLQRSSRRGTSKRDDDADVVDNAATFVDDITQRYPNGRIDLSLPTIQIVYPELEETKGDAVESLVRSVVDCENVFCVGDYSMLCNVKDRMVGADSWSPTFGGTKVNIDSDKSIMLSLLLPTWADNISDQNCVDAEMDPYLRAIDSFDFQELLSVKYSTSSGVIR